MFNKIIKLRSWMFEKDPFVLGMIDGFLVVALVCACVYFLN